MTEEDRRFVELTAETVATKVADKLIDDLPCKENTKMLVDHESKIHDGLQDDVKELKETLVDHQQRHHNSEKEKTRSRKAFRRGFLIAGLTLVVGIVFRDLIPKLFGG